MRLIPRALRTVVPVLAFLSSGALASAQQQHGHAAQTASPPAVGQRTPAPQDAYVYIGWPNEGQTLNAGRIKLWFGARNIGVAPAGVTFANTGHHHLLINVPMPPLDEPIPNTKNHLHFGAGQTEAFIDLTPGTYTLQLLMGDAEHVPHDPPISSKKITIHVR
jgi:Domain of unknown function (DUF4399)